VAPTEERSASSLCGGRRQRVLRAAKEEAMIVFGMFLFVLAILLKINFLSTMGLIFLIVGGVFSISGYLGHPVGGHRYWY
jgi:hypothetical protein